jgi:hypothetical protein
MYVIGAAFEIPFITNGVPPKALLPKGIFAAMIAQIGAPVAMTLRVKLPLIRRHLSEKSESPGGNVRIACK